MCLKMKKKNKNMKIKSCLFIFQLLLAISSEFLGPTRSIIDRGWWRSSSPTTSRSRVQWCPCRPTVRRAIPQHRDAGDSKTRSGKRASR